MHKGQGGTARQGPGQVTYSLRQAPSLLVTHFSGVPVQPYSLLLFFYFANKERILVSSRMLAETRELGSCLVSSRNVT